MAVKISKKYNPPEKYCEKCGRLFITRNPTEYAFRKRDYRKDSPTHGKTIWFCSESCMTAFEKEHGRKKYNAGFKS